MPYEKEFATGESLIALGESEALRAFSGTIRVREGEGAKGPEPRHSDVPRRAWKPHRVVAIDGSNIVKAVRNGFPGAEAGLIQISAVIIDPKGLMALAPADIPRPQVFHKMERAKTLEAVLPGANVVRKNLEDDAPKVYFRQVVFDTMSGAIAKNHESLIDTYRAIIKDRQAIIACPIDGCDQPYLNGAGSYSCSCGKGRLFETDALRFHERFNEIGSNGEVHGEVRHVLELLALLNILRYFAVEERAYFLRNCAFVLDGPLAVFGQPAWLLPYIKDELCRINDEARRFNGEDIVVFGLEKSGQFMDHFGAIDWSDEEGPRRRFPNGFTFIPDAAYVNRNIVFRPADAKPHGASTYFGRKVLYKTRSGEHAVINTAMVNKGAHDFMRSALDCFPRLGDVLDIMDHLSTYLYKDGFMPLVRAHAHAAIPLQRGGEILENLFKADGQAG